MSYALSLRRAAGAAPITADDLARAAAGLPGWTAGGSPDRLAWRADSGARLALSLAGGELLVAGLARRHEAEGLAALRSLAGRLDARLLGEEGEDLTDPDPTGGPVPAGAAAAGGVLALLAAPLLLVLAVLRLPWLLWKLLRAGRAARGRTPPPGL